MIPANPGNLLPFYRVGYIATDRRWQRHRLPGQDVIPYGLPCPRSRLIPFQLPVEIGLLGITSFALINAEDDTETIVLDVTELEFEAESATNRHWITWKADTDLSIIPDCGYWYVFLNITSVGQFVSEVLYCTDFCGFESVGLSLADDSCGVDVGGISFTINANVVADNGASWEIQEDVAGEWTTIGTGASVALVRTLSSGGGDFRIVFTSNCGVTTTVTYEATWDVIGSEESICASLTFDEVSNVTDESAILSTGPVWRLNFGNTTDKADVLYQTGYEQYLYLPTVIWDVPEIERQTEIRVNGLGQETRRFTRTVERRGFETPDLPDYVLGWLTKSGDLDTIKMEDAKLIDAAAQVEFSIENLTFESPNRQGTALNIGRFYFDVEAEAFQGCQENWIID